MPAQPISLTEIAGEQIISLLPADAQLPTSSLLGMATATGPFAAFGVIGMAVISSLLKPKPNRWFWSGVKKYNRLKKKTFLLFIEVQPDLPYPVGGLRWQDEDDFKPRIEWLGHLDKLLLEYQDWKQKQGRLSPAMAGINRGALSESQKQLNILLEDYLSRKAKAEGGSGPIRGFKAAPKIKTGPYFGLADVEGVPSIFGLPVHAGYKDDAGAGAGQATTPKAIEAWLKANSLPLERQSGDLWLFPSGQVIRYVPAKIQEAMIKSGFLKSAVWKGQVTEHGISGWLDGPDLGKFGNGLTWRMADYTKERLALVKRLMALVNQAGPPAVPAPKPNPVPVPEPPGWSAITREADLGTSAEAPAAGDDFLTGLIKWLFTPLW